MHAEGDTAAKAARRWNIAPGAPTDRNDGGGRAQHVQCVCLSTERQLNGRLRLCTGSPWLEVAGSAIRFPCRSRCKAPVVVGTTASRKDALQRREFGTNRKRQAKTGICRKRLHHARVLFVQHPPKNALAQGFPRGSFIACAGSFGNCVRATEGGIPKSSRVQVVSLTSLAFSGCVRRRDET
jgi:hypothetical protein